MSKALQENDKKNGKKLVKIDMKKLSRRLRV